MREQLISAELKPVAGDVVPGSFVIGAPLLPSKFIWGDTEFSVAEIIETWKETSPCTHGSGERYVRKHWFRIRTTTNEEMKIYFERKQRSPKDKKHRWWLYTLKSL